MFRCISLGECEGSLAFDLMTLEGWVAGSLFNCAENIGDFMYVA